MPVLNDDSSVYFGSVPVSAIYSGGTKIWPVSTTPTTGPLSRFIQPVILTLTARPLAHTTGPSNRTLTPVTLTLTPVTFAHGSVLNRTLTPVTLTLTPRPLATSISAITRTLTPVTMTLTPVALTGTTTQQTFVDNFNRANSPNLGTNWIPQQGTTWDRAQIVANKFKYLGSTVGVREQWVGPSFVPGPNVEVGYIDTSNQQVVGSDHWIVARWDDVADTWYGFWFNQPENQYGIMAVVNANYNWILGPNSGLGWVSGDRWTLKIVGSLIQVFRNGSLFASVIDNQITDAPTRRRFGVVGWNNSPSDYIEVDNYEATNIVGTTVGVDLVIDDIIFTTPTAFPAPISNFNEDDHILFRATIRNQGDVAMPAGTIANNQQVGIAFKIDGTTVTWHDQYEGGLAVGDSITLTANGHPGDAAGASGINYWVATAGAHTVQAELNQNPQRKTEANYTNNYRSENFTVLGPGGEQGLAHTAYVWGGASTVFNVDSGANGVNAATLLSNGITGLIVSGQGDWWVDDPYFGIFQRLTAAGLKMLAGKYAGVSPDPINAGAIASHIAAYQHVWGRAALAGATGGAIDCEPYTYGGTLWHVISPTDAANFGTGIGQAALAVGFEEIIMYCSSDASWPGSYVDLVQFQASGLHSHDTSRFPNFVTALVNTGIPVTHTDATFHHGPQLSGYTWDMGAELSVDLANDFHPDLKGSIMFWPDVDEGSFSPPNDGYPAGVTQVATEAADNHSTGPFTIYQGNLANGTMISRWNGWLAEINAVMDPTPPPPPPPPSGMPTFGNTGPNSTNGSITIDQWISAGTASNKVITGNYTQRGSDIVGRTLTATDCEFTGQFFYLEPSPQATPNLPHLILTRCAFTGGFITAGAMNLELYACYIIQAYWTPCASCGGEDHAASQTNRIFPVICNDTMFHCFRNNAPSPSFHTEALHLVGGNIGLHFNNTRFAMEGPFSDNTTGAMKATCIDSSFTNCWWDWNGGTPGSYYTIYLEGRNVTVSGGRCQRATRNFGGTAFDGYYYANQSPNGPAPWSPAGGGGANNYVIPPSLNNLHDWFTDQPIVNNQI